ncbi:peptidoglycan/xylan/chitin deacetylase (PgdA/CDA1 family) [Rhizobium petrolearium]|uniref:polysaccharide deacetylase family protein n=1 Tax=Neorhizobium petrolearium TaxID=515361 RepID=UPI001AEAC424|nr:polysaccharide deacetylase family protein [Neorhizobium petrolearium]MBP1845491.1 peptidoglycan/xylan/chitin deacetylase (PgdA/CDA1 family) [Neorhizobium petrolearium]
MASASHMTRDFVGYGAKGYDPRWPNDARLALNIVLNVEEGSEPSVPDGDPTSEAALTEGGSGSFEGRDLAAESMFEYGSRVGFWRLAGMLEERGLPATAMACAVALQRNPEIADYLRTSQFDVCAHGWRWEHHRGLSLEEERDRIAKTVHSIKALTGTAPDGWYCRYGPSLNTRSLLVEHGGFSYDSDAYNEELPYWVKVGERNHLVVPYSLTNNDAKFMRGAVATGDQFFQFLRDAFDVLYAEGKHRPKMMSVGLHLRVAGHPGRAAGVQRFFDHVSRHDGVWVCRRGDIARHWHQHHQPS